MEKIVSLRHLKLFLEKINTTFIRKSDVAIGNGSSLPIRDKLISLRQLRTFLGNLNEIFIRNSDLIQRNTAYVGGEVLRGKSLPAGYNIVVLSGGTTGDKEPDFEAAAGYLGKIVTDGTVKLTIRDTRCLHHVGDIVAKAGAPAAYEYLLPCDGSTFDTATYQELALLLPDGKLPKLQQEGISYYICYA